MVGVRKPRLQLETVAQTKYSSYSIRWKLLSSPETFQISIELLRIIGYLCSALSKSILSPNLMRILLSQMFDTSYSLKGILRAILMHLSCEWAVG